tara:strand:- start:2151 stop:3206 length:1056 start_codon:yes stop_codon:yes gene_type:complete
MGDSPVRQSKGRLIELDALRGIGAITVVLFHLTTRFPQVFPGVDHVPFSFWAGEYRVLLFFAISGFAIFFTLERIGTVADFAVNRFSRLFPAYWATLPIVLAFVWLGDVERLQISPMAALANVTMLQGFLYLPAIDGAYWTLTVELGFYASMTGLWLLLGRKFDNLEPMLLPWLALKGLMFVWEGMPSRVAMLLVLQFVPYFIIGILFYRIWSGQRRWYVQLPYFAAALLTLLLTDQRDMFLAGCALVITFAATLGGGLRFLNVRPILWFGAISYPLYLVHENIGFVILLKAQAAGLDHWSALVLALGVIVPIAAALHYRVELPASRWISVRWKAYRSGRNGQRAEALSAR